MKCAFCKRDESEISEVFVPLINNIEINISKLEFKIKDIKEKYAKENGFTDDNFAKAKNINENILKIKINAFMDNLEPFVNMEKNTQLLKIYLEKYNPKVSKEETLNKLVDLYVEEPTETRLDHEVHDLVQEKNILTSCIEEIKSKNRLIEVENALNVPFGVFDFNDELKYKIIDELIKISIARKKNRINKDKLFLCPYCLYLNKISLTEIKNIKEKYIPNNLKQSRSNWYVNPLEE
jgi:hypothetical protein